MADINHVISLGIGSPASIKFFITLGLGFPTYVDLTLRNRSTVLTLDSNRGDDLYLTLFGRSVNLTVEDRAQ